MSVAKTVILSILFTIPVHAAATTAINAVVARHENALTSVVTDMRSPIGTMMRRYYSAGPATMPWRDSISVSHVAATFDIDRQSSPVSVQEGNGHNLYRLEADSYYKLSDKTTVWGDASFTAGVIKNVSWAGCIDYSLLAPYMLGDDTGGNLTCQRYIFGGGWARNYRLWTVGVSAEYRAETAHRSRDPRVRDIASDLTITVGVGHTISSNYTLALDASLRVYHQDCDIDYYNPANTIMTRPMTGLGSVYTRFDNNMCNSSGHNLNGYGAALSLVPVHHGDGLSTRVSFISNKASMVLRGFNNITLAETLTRDLDFAASWHFGSQRTVSLFPTLKANLSDRKGTENLFGMSSGSSYEKVGSRSNYIHRIFTASISVPVEWKLDGLKLRLTATPSVAYLSDDEKLLEPSRRLQVDHRLASLLLAAISRPGSNTSLTAGVEGRIRSASAKTPSWGNLDLTTPLGQSVKSNYDMLSAHTRSISAHAVMSQAISGKILSLRIRYIRAVYHSLGHNDSASLTLSLTF